MKTITQQLVEKAMKIAQGAQATLVKSEATDINYEYDKLKSAQSSQRTDINLKVIVDGKVGSSRTTNINDLDGLVSRAIEAARFGSPARFDMPGYSPAEEVELYDAAVKNVTKTEMVRLGQEMLESVKAYNPDILVMGGSGKKVNYFEFTNSAGLSFADDTTEFGVYVGGELVRGTDILYAGKGMQWRKREIDHQAVASEAIHYFRMAETIVPCQSGDIPIIFTPEGAAVLMLTLVQAVDGKNVVLGTSPLGNKIGEQVADLSFTLIDDGLVDYGMPSGRYDGEGIPRRSLPIIENGILRNFLYDLDTAARAGVQSNGHGVGCQPTSLIVKEGKVSFEEILKDTPQGILVHDVMGLGQGNSINGEFSVNLQLAYKIENGQIVGRVKDTMLSGNVYDALKHIVAISNKAEWVSGYFSGKFPYIKIDSLAVTAK